ncbi:dUTP diphosphatase [Peribacillus asahii]|uniref:dUTP diphosphatase n=1 Tax=Peribacillus asahii TaxID=228899 RepID=UPI00381A2C81
MNVKIKKISEHAVIPKYAKQGDSGFDLVAIEDVVIEPGETKKIPTGLAFEIPQGYELQVRPRSGITSKTKLRVQLGTVDAGYRGEVSVIVDNIAPIPDSDSGYWPESISGQLIELSKEEAYFLMERTLSVKETKLLKVSLLLSSMQLLKKWMS